MVAYSNYCCPRSDRHRFGRISGLDFSANRECEDTGNWKNWKALSKVNPTLDLNRIVIGANILIPEDLLKSHKPMPFSFLSSSVPKKRVQTITSKKPSTTSGTAELFGPIDYDQPSTESGVVEIFGPIENDLSSFDSDTIELFKPIE